MTLMPLLLPEFACPIRIRLEHPLTDDELLRLCEQNGLFHVEREPDGTLLARKIGGTESGFLASNLIAQLGKWAEADGRGRAYSYAGFLLKDGSMRGPTLAWVSNGRMATLTAEQRSGFAPVCPEFVIELLSWSYTLQELQSKMKSWIANGVQLAWLVDSTRKAVELYRPDRGVEVIEGGRAVEGEGPVSGFILERAKIRG